MFEDNTDVNITDEEKVAAAQRMVEEQEQAVADHTQQQFQLGNRYRYVLNTTGNFVL